MTIRGAKSAVKQYIQDMKLDVGIIAMDLDDTLLRHDLTISDRTVATLRRAAE